MIKITICIGSSCHIKGSKEVVERLQYLISKNYLSDKVQLCGSFCMNRCQEGVCCKVNDEFFSLSINNVDEFFNKNVLSKF